jgi:uroporphyrinogen-III synthase
VPPTEPSERDRDPAAISPKHEFGTLMRVVGPLIGFTVGITGHRRWEEQAEILTRRGAKVLHGPTMSTRLMGDSDRTLAATRRAMERPADLVVITTGLGVRSWFSALESWGLDDDARRLLAGATIMARGPKAASAATAAGLVVGWMAATETNAEVIAQLATQELAGCRVVVLRDGGDPVVAERIAAMGADVVDVPVYVWESPDDPAPARRLLEAAARERLDAVTFTCSYAVRNAFELAAKPDALRAAFMGRVRAVAVGPVTASTLRDHGVERVIEPKRARLGSMMHVLTVELESMRRILRLGDHTMHWHGSALIDDGGQVTELTHGEVQLLDRLLARSPAVVGKRALASGDTDEHAVEAAVARLRAKLGHLSVGIATVRRRGYACTIEVVPSEVGRPWVGVGG